MERELDLDTLSLAVGNHHDRSNGLCIMEAVAWVAGEPHSDHPECVSPILGAFLRKWNDDVDDQFRQRLKPFIPRVIDTAGNPEADQWRGWMLVNWLIRVHTAAWLELVPALRQHAEALRALPEITDEKSLRAITAGPLTASRKDSAAAWDAAWAAAWDAAWDALKPTKLSLQESALDLLERMIVA